MAVMLLLAAACETDSAPEPPIPAEDESIRQEGPRALEAEAWLTFHRLEVPVPVRRTILLGPEEQEGRSVGDVLLEGALHELVQGPTDVERDAGISSFFSHETRHILQSVDVEGERATVDFREFRHLLPAVSSSAGSEAFLAELNGTVFANSPVAQVEYRLEGSCEDFWAFLQRACTVVDRPRDL